MDTTSSHQIFEELIDVLAGSVDRNAILNFRIPPESQDRLNQLLERNRQGNLTPTELAELGTYEQFEHVVRLLKARLLKNS